MTELRGQPWKWHRRHELYVSFETICILSNFWVCLVETWASLNITCIRAFLWALWEGSDLVLLYPCLDFVNAQKCLLIVVKCSFLVHNSKAIYRRPVDFRFFNFSTKETLKCSNLNLRSIKEDLSSDRRLI